MFVRDKYLKQLIDKKHNQLIKVITGIRRSGKSFLLNEIFYRRLTEEDGVDPSHIIRFAFDNSEDISLLDAYLPDQPTIIVKKGQEIVNDRKFLLYVKDQIHDEGDYYFLLDEIQNLNGFVRVLNGFLRHANYDVYVSGSNSHLLSSDIDTEFGGRSSRVHLLPLAFNEYRSDSKLDPYASLNEYLQYGGIPLVQKQGNAEEKKNQAVSIYKDTYLSDVKKRHPKAEESRLDETLKVIASMISSPINPTKIENTFRSKRKLPVANNAIDTYISWFQDAFLLNKALRYDIKGRGYIGSPYKIYFEDIGIRNAILDFRDIDETDLIENMVYNELRYRGFQVDVGVVYLYEPTGKKDKAGKDVYLEKATEVDFVANKGGKRYYIQVALQIDTEEKKEQEYRSIRHIPDSFKKIIIVKNDIVSHQYTNDGFLRMNLMEFLTNEESLEW